MVLIQKLMWWNCDKYDWTEKDFKNSFCCCLLRLNREKEEERMEENIFEEDLNARTSSKQENGTFIESRPGAKPLLNRDLNLSSSIAISIMAGNENVFFCCKMNVMKQDIVHWLSIVIVTFWIRDIFRSHQKGKYFSVFNEKSR